MQTDWTDIEAAARQMAGNWHKFPCFAWSRGYHLKDADQWAIWYTCGRDAGLLEQSNHEQIAKRLAPYLRGDEPDVVIEHHSHWAVGYLDGFSLRVYGKDGTTDAFREFCRIQDDLDAYPILNEADYSEREYTATLDNYRSEMWATKDALPDGWEAEVYAWFGDHGLDRFIENTDDRGGWAPKEKITEALQDLGMMPGLTIAAR